MVPLSTHSAFKPFITIAKINKRSQWNKGPPWKSSQKTIKVHGRLLDSEDYIHTHIVIYL